MKQLGVIFILSVVAGCDNPLPECEAGELRYTGRPPARVFDMCNGEASADGACNIDEAAEVLIDASGRLENGDRELTLFDADTAGEPSDTNGDAIPDDWDGVLDDLGERYALSFRFGFYDQSGGTAPAGWSFVEAGPGTYRHGMLDGSARFVIETAMVEVAEDVHGAVVGWRAVAPASELLEAATGRIEVLDVDKDGIEGRFFLGYESPTGQPQGQVNGCFHVDMSAPLPPENSRVLGE